MGMMAARGRKIFFADADRAMPFTEFQKINEKFEYLHDKYPDLLVIGSRAHLEKESIAQRSLFRTILMKVSSWGIISYIISSPVWCCAWRCGSAPNKWRGSFGCFITMTSVPMAEASIVHSHCG